MSPSEQDNTLYMNFRLMFKEKLDDFPRLHSAVVFHKNIRGEPMTFRDKPYLLDIYKETAQEVVMQSSVQTGKSELLLVTAHHWAERGLQVLYVLPTIELRSTFVANRVDRLHHMVPHYAKMLAQANSVSNNRTLKMYGPNNGAIFFAGSNSSGTYIEKPIDLVIADELNKFDLENHAKADDRMTASSYKYKFEASNPSVDNFGINARYLEGDQREWIVKCPSCNAHQRLNWWKNVVRQTDSDQWVLRDDKWSEGCGRDIQMICKKCHNPLDRFTFASQWLAKFPNRERTHSYLIHQMLSSYVRLDEMWFKYQKALGDDTGMQVFYNSMLGETFAGKGAKLTDEVLNSCKQSYNLPVKANNCFMGVDVGKFLHVTIFQLCHGGTLRLVFAGTVRHFEDLDALFDRFEIISYVIDSMPESRKALEYARKRPGRGWVARYHQGLDEIKADADTRLVSADRTMTMDQVQKFFLNKQFILPANAQSLDNGNFYNQLRIPTRVYDEEKDRFNWRGDPDHYFHSINYAVLAYKARGEFRVVGLNPRRDAPQTIRHGEEFDTRIFPPGTPEGLINHYRSLFEEGKRLAQQRRNY